MTDGILRFGGMPTDAEVRMLLERFGKPKENTPIPYTEVEKTLGFARDGQTENRFNTVTAAWRRALVRDHNIHMRRGGGCFVALDPSGRVDLSGSKIKRGVRSIRRGGKIVSTTDRSRLSEDDVRRADHIQVLTAAFNRAASIESKRKAPELPIGKV
jgi:hypothetical protein